jgi:hypothetical protein
VAKRLSFNYQITSILGDSVALPIGPLQDLDNNPYDLEPYGELHDDILGVPKADFVDATGRPVLQQFFTDTLINIDVMLPNGDGDALAKVMRHAVDDTGMVVGTLNENPLLNTILYECEFGDGTTKEYAANTIAFNIYMESDLDGFSGFSLYHIIDHKRSGDAITMENKYFTTRSGAKRMRQTTVGWKLLVQWNKGSRQWIDLKVLKESNPVHIAEYATARGISNEPAFAWWVPYTLRKRDVNVSAVNSRLCRTNHKYGIELPTTVWEALAIDHKNGNTLWAGALTKEMGNVCIAFEILGPNERAPPGWHKASGHIVFDIKMDFTRKARWVKDGHKTPDSPTPSFAGVVSRESICICLTYAALLGLPVWGADICNAYLQAPSSEKHFVICGPEFGIENEGPVALVCRALYGG